MLIASSTQIKSSLQSTLIDSQRLAVKTLSLFAGTCILVVGSSILGVCARTFSVGVGALVMGTLAVGTLVTGTLAVSTLVMGILAVGSLVMGILAVCTLVIGTLVVGTLVILAVDKLADGKYCRIS